jgi:hypothetical protein
MILKIFVTSCVLLAVSSGARAVDLRPNQQFINNLRIYIGSFEIQKAKAFAILDQETKLFNLIDPKNVSERNLKLKSTVNRLVDVLTILEPGPNGESVGNFYSAVLPSEQLSSFLLGSDTNPADPQFSLARIRENLESLTRRAAQHAQNFIRTNLIIRE